MDEEKRAEDATTEEKRAEGKAAPIVTRSMRDEACPTCGAEVPSMPEVLPDPSWSTEKLIEATKDKHMLVRSNAIILLSKRAPSEALEALIEALKDEEYLVKSNAMVAIAAYGKQISDRMIQALDDADKDVRAGAAWVVGELKDNRAIEALERVAKDDYPLARIQAKASLLAMGRGLKKGSKDVAPKEEAKDTSIDDKAE
ncbi:MAG: HEAT repeat protein [Methanosaeta sp. PtaB.Bin018]|jgi:HEAT repeat protein|nr:HEAT repeat domain-containing protein [Methanothrix sp.]OPX74397.1 MAG: HEAT repeat protein [Methanosaeta sp. PtaB.Bin018]OPY44052.1 MAG: HEAT repeat protein [Methanosaeta sp. PtaU1.Bin016]